MIIISNLIKIIIIKMYSTNGLYIKVSSVLELIEKITKNNKITTHLSVL